jgi:hypothetical protein
MLRDTTSANGYMAASVRVVYLSVYYSGDYYSFASLPVRSVE